MTTAQNQDQEDANINGLDLPLPEPVQNNNSGQQYSSGTVVNGRSASSPTKPNPLGNLSSYTYGLSLYMVNTDVMNQFIRGGGTMAGINGSTRGVRVVAQSGGFAAADQPLKTLEGIPIEYYIDDLNLTTYLPGGPQKATASTEIKFKINEPMGFTFLQDLTRAGFDLNAQSNVNAPNMNGIQQHFIIGIKFYGYDVNGNVITQVPSNPKGGNTNPGQLPERYFAIRITKVKFKLDGRMITYNCESVVVSESIANGQVNGLLKSSTTLTGSTVWDVLANPTNKNSLVSALNSATAAEKDSGKVKIPTNYSIEFLDENNNDVGKDSVIGKAKLVNDAVFDSSLGSTFNVSSAEKSTIAQQFKAVSIDGTKVSIPQVFGQTLLTIIDNVITKSEYISAALNQINTATAETQTKSKESTELEWYSVNPVITAKDFDEKTNDWAYEIKFQIKAYPVPYIRTVNATRVSTYPGPSKRYDYWLTGANSEIISYEQQYDNLFYVMTVASRAISPAEQPNTGSAPVHSQNATNGDSNGSQNKQFEYNKEIAAQMYSPGDQAMVKIRIMGDPDYIMSTTGVNYAPSIGNNNAGIDPLKGQVFIEIKFLMATDYGANGLLNVSGNIQFYNDQMIKDLGIDGVVYKVYRIDSVFSKGLFSQTLSCVLVDQQLLSKGREKTTATKSESVGDQRAESASTSPRVIAGVTLNSLGRTSGGPTAEELAAYQNRPPSSVDLRTPQSSYGKGIQQSLNPLPLTTKPSVAQIQNSQVYKNALRSGVGARTAYNIAERALSSNVNNDDAVIGRPRGGQ